jgi:hypothetical protein
MSKNRSIPKLVIGGVLIALLLSSCGKKDDHSWTKDNTALMKQTELYLIQASSVWGITSEEKESAVNGINSIMSYYEGPNTDSFSLIAKAIEEGNAKEVKNIYADIGGDVTSFSIPESSGIPSSAPVYTTEPEIDTLTENATSSHVQTPSIHLKGTGTKATDSFDLESGYAIFEIDYTGDANFYANLLSPSGDEMLLVANHGKYTGRLYKKLSEHGSYLINTTADGTWSVNVTQSYAGKTYSSPASISGSGDDVFFVNLETGNRTFNLENKGTKMFMAELDGRLLGVENGNYSGSKALSIEEKGTYPLTIKSDGQWSVDIK